VDGEVFSRHFHGVPGHRWLAALAGLLSLLASWLAALAGKPLEVFCFEIQNHFARRQSNTSSKKLLLFVL